ncbi:MAG TPA: isoprenylcysteine carboxylmethyltransferase family protein [Stellaceae bacterium]|nr:isoprenylcysteine carboxylmethyltransferase family protein [Stellaceae bacterium]
MTPLYWTLALVAAQRLAELAWASHNTAGLRHLGAIEVDAGGYPYFVTLHAGWLTSLALLVPPATPPNWALLGVFALLQPARIWVISSLGRFWSTRVLTLPGAPLIHSGPYRWLRHPNYLIVTAEIALLPLAFGSVAITAAFSALNLTLVLRRIAIEDRALAPRRGL